MTLLTNCVADKNVFKKKILIDLDGVLNEYGKEKFDENFIPEIKIGAFDFLDKLSKDAELITNYSLKSNKSLTSIPKLSAIIFNFVTVTSVFASSIRLIIALETPLTPISS